MNNLFENKILIKNIHKVINRDSLIFCKDKIIDILKNAIVDWDIYINFSPDNYVKTLVYRNFEYEIYVISWNKNQESPIHDHPNKGCIMKILEGEIEEIRYNNNLDIIKTKKYKEGNITYIDNNIGYHKMRTVDKCITLHIYSPPEYKMNIFKKF